MTPEQIAVFADEESPALMTGAFYGISSMYADEPKIAQAFQSGEGLSWGDHQACLFCGTEKFFRPSYRSNLLASWIPALEGVEEKLNAGIKVADIGCGHGVPTMILAEAFPKSEFIGFDFHEPSIEHSTKKAREAGLKNVSFEVGSAKDYPGDGYQLVTLFD